MPYVKLDHLISSFDLDLTIALRCLDRLLTFHFAHHQVGFSTGTGTVPHRTAPHRFRHRQS